MSYICNIKLTGRLASCQLKEAIPRYRGRSRPDGQRIEAPDATSRRYRGIGVIELNRDAGIDAPTLPPGWRAGEWMDYGLAIERMFFSERRIHRATGEAQCQTRR